MSDSNVGWSKEIRSINHIFVLNWVIYETIRSKNSKPVTLQIFDFEQMFWRTSVTWRHKETQGDTWAPLMASNQVDSLGTQILEENPNYLYKYTGYVPISVLGMIDDVVGLSESGVKAKQLTAFINVKSAEKGLHFGTDKCHTMNTTTNIAPSVENYSFINHLSEKHKDRDYTCVSSRHSRQCITLLKLMMELMFFFLFFFYFLKTNFRTFFFLKNLKLTSHLNR